MQTEPAVGSSGQLTLQLALSDEATFDNFYPRPALAELLSALQTPAVTHLGFVHGPAGGGKTHLLQALCQACPGAMYLPMEALVSSPPVEVLCDLEHSTLVAFDRLELAAASPQWQEALFHFLNRAFAAECPVWVAARRPPDDLKIDLADLRSRLAGGLTFAVAESDDEEKAMILRFRAARRGLELSEPVARFLCSRDSRSLSDLLATLVKLDAVSLQLQRPLTVPLIKQVLGY